MKQHSGKFCKYSQTGQWALIVKNQPAAGDTIKTRKADGSVFIALFKAVLTSHAGGFVCDFAEIKTVSQETVRNSSVIDPRDVQTRSRSAWGKRIVDRERRDSYEERHQIGL